MFLCLLCLTRVWYRYVKLILPEGVESDRRLSSLQEQFEQILIDYDLLKADIEAMSDELGRGVNEDGVDAANTIRRSKAK